MMDMISASRLYIFALNFVYDLIVWFNQFLDELVGTFIWSLLICFIIFLSLLLNGGVSAWNGHK
jgi:hypothetical protein